MRKLLLFNALWAVFVGIASVGVAGAQVRDPEEWEGHESTQCEPATHASYYDLRNGNQGALNPDEGNGDNVYYVDTNPLSDFRADGNYEDHQPTHDCDGTPVLRTTAYAMVVVQGELWFPDQRKGVPACSSSRWNTRNPGCKETRTGVYGGFYVATPDRSTNVGYETGAANPFSEDDGGNLP